MIPLVWQLQEPGRQALELLFSVLMKAIPYWLPAAFCALISFLGLIGTISSGSQLWQPAFIVFLAPCFFYVGNAMLQMSREISRLRHRIARLEQERTAEPYLVVPSGVSAVARRALRY